MWVPVNARQVTVNSGGGGGGLDDNFETGAIGWTSGALAWEGAANRSVEAADFGCLRSRVIGEPFDRNKVFAQIVD